MLCILGILGFSLCLTIIHSKNKQIPLVCPMEGNCEDVLHSKYSTFFGIPLEILGITYYTIVAVAYGFFLFLPHGPLPIGALLLTTLSFVAFIVSIILICIQAFLIKHWCTWCLMSAGLSILIALLSILTLSNEAFSILIDSVRILARFFVVG